MENTRHSSNNDPQSTSTNWQPPLPTQAKDRHLTSHQSKLYPPQLPDITNSYTQNDSLNQLIIGTHNVRGINTQTKQDSLIDDIQQKKIDVLGLSETKLTTTEDIWTFNKHKTLYKCYSSSNPAHPFGAGVAILVKKNLAAHIEEVTRIDGRIISIRFLFRKCVLTIYQIYLPSNTQDSRQYQRILRQMITKEREKNSKAKIIVMGDFNATVKPERDRSRLKPHQSTWKPEIDLFNFLEDWAFLDVQEFFEPNTPSPTWSNKISNSRIDYIWTSREFGFDELVEVNNENIDNITGSDHTMLTLTIKRKGITELKSNAQIRKKGTTNLLDLANTTKEQWTDYKNLIEKSIKKNQLFKELSDLKKDIHKNTAYDPQLTQSRLNKIWNTIENMLRKSGKKTLSQRKVKGISSFKLKEKPLTKEYLAYRKALKLHQFYNKTLMNKDSKSYAQLMEAIELFNTKN
jgi:exonuclease III